MNKPKAVVNTSDFADVVSWVGAHRYEPEKIADLIVWQRQQLDQLATFNPDWDLLKATQDALHQALTKTEKT